MNSKQSLNNLESRKNKFRAGDFVSINDAKTRGHKSLITRIYRKKNIVKHIPTTHKSMTRNMKNIELIENPQLGDKQKSYVLPKEQTSKTKYVGKKQSDMQIRNATDKSIIRHIKNVSTKK